MMDACGFTHTLVVTQDGALWACGMGRFGQLGHNATGNRHVFEQVGVGVFGGARVVAAAAGRFHSAAVTEDGSLWTWGEGNEGQLGLSWSGHGECRLEPTVVLGAPAVQFL